MLQKARLFGIVAFVAAIGFSMAGCRVDPAPMIFDVTVDPGAAGVVRGGNHYFAATVWGFPDPPQTVRWEVEGGVEGTQIADSGRLTVANNETATTITVRAISTSDNGVSGTATVTVLREGGGGVIIIPGDTLAESLAWLRVNASSGGSYVVELSGNEMIGPDPMVVEEWDDWGNWTQTTTPTLPTDRTNLTITLRGGEAMRTISLSDNGNLFVVGSSVTLVLDDNITLMGRHNDNHLVRVNSGGTLVMKEGARITGNTNTDIWWWDNRSGGVRVNSGGTFEMRGGEIAGNSVGSASSTGGGVHVASGGMFRISDGVIHGSDAAAELRNTATATSSGAALFNSGTAQRGTFNADGVFSSLGNLTTINSTLHVTNGVLQGAEGGTLAEQFAWLREFAQSGGSYIVELNDDETIGPDPMVVEEWDDWGNWTQTTTPTLPTDRTNLTITLRGGETMRTISLSDYGNLFVVGSGITLVLDDNITLVGRNNDNHLVRVNSGGTLVMNDGARITGNTNPGTWSANSGGGVRVNSGGMFEMRGGEIAGNSVGSASSTGGGVHVDWGGIFRISDGIIHGSDAAAELQNTATATGSGAALFNSGTAQRGTFNADGFFTSLGNLTTTDGTVQFVDGELPELTGTVSITGTLRVGHTLTANVTDLGGMGTISFQWRRGTTDILGATSSTHIVQTADMGSTISVVVTRELNSSSATGTAASSIANIEWAVVSTGGSHTVALEEGGTLWAWGFNGGGRLGDGTTTMRLSPVHIGTDTDWEHVSAGDSHTVAIKTDGSLWAWGFNGDGRLGDGTTTMRLSPVHIGTDTDWEHVSAGGSHTVAIRTDGTLWAWGNNASGQLGNGSTWQETIPTQIGAAANWASVSAGTSHTVAITTTGQLWAWGNMENGRTGQGQDWGSQTTPIQVGTDRSWEIASAGASHTVAVTTTGELWAWGNRENGRIGEGETTGSQTYPIRVGTATNWATASAGDAHTVAVRTNGTAWTWGNNTNGQLGDGTTIQRDAPVQIGVLTSWAYISAGGSHRRLCQKCKK